MSWCLKAASPALGSAVLVLGVWETWPQLLKRMLGISSPKSLNDVAGHVVPCGRSRVPCRVLKHRGAVWMTGLRGGPAALGSGVHAPVPLRSGRSREYARSRAVTSKAGSQSTLSPQQLPIERVLKTCASRWRERAPSTPARPLPHGVGPCSPGSAPCLEGP